MSRGGRHTFLDHWHRRELPLPDGDTLRLVRMAPPGRRPHAECFRRIALDGASGGVHATDALRLLAEAQRPDSGHVHVETYDGQSFTH